MLKVFVFLFLFNVNSLISQHSGEVSIFHRLLILNADNELMVVKIENSDFWVTPGLYQNDRQTIKSGLDSIAGTYGLQIYDPSFKGMFTLEREINGTHSYSLRNVFLAWVKEDHLVLPQGISDVKWLPINKATELISFPHINTMIRQVMEHPGVIWGGSLLQYKDHEGFKTRILEEFYPLNTGVSIKN